MFYYISIFWLRISNAVFFPYLVKEYKYWKRITNTANIVLLSANQIEDIFSCERQHVLTDTNGTYLFSIFICIGVLGCSRKRNRSSIGFRWKENQINPIYYLNRKVKQSRVSIKITHTSPINGKLLYYKLIIR